MKTLRMLLFVLLLAQSAAFSQKEPQNFSQVMDTLTLISKINAANASIQTMQCDFTQEKYLSIMSDKVNSQGKLYFKSPGFIRWEYTLPYSYVIVFNQNKVYIQDEKKLKKMDLSSNKNFSELNENLTAIVQGKLFSKRTEFNYTYQENEKQYRVSLQPISKRLRDLFTSIIVYFNKKDFSVYGIKLMEPGKDYSLLRFSNRKNNLPIPNEKFVIH